MDWKAEIEMAAARIAGYVVETPVVQMRAFGLNYPVELKLEQMQHTGSFKARGAFNSILKYPLPPEGVVAASGGNHGAAVAFAASRLGSSAKIFVPELAGPAKINLIRRSGADLEVVPGEYANAAEAARKHEIHQGGVQIHAYDAIETVAGQGTLSREWEMQGLSADTILIAVGGGGLIAGALAWFGTSKKIVAVEPVNCPTLHTALAEGKPVDVQPSGIAANALGARRIGEICFDLAKTSDLASVLVDDDAIAAAQTALWQEARQLVEPAGATALAALTSGAYTPAPGERVAVLVCGANPKDDPFSV
ncbi:MAG: threonine/serine dehydratase [Pseudomonadota bacterium]